MRIKWLIKNILPSFMIKWYRNMPPPPRVTPLRVGTENESNRIAWLEKTLKKIPDGNKILDAGAGELQFKKYCSHLNYLSQDFNQYDGKGDGKSLQMQSWDQSKIDIVSDIVNIPSPDSSFDAICALKF